MSKNPFGSDHDRYWERRYALFSKFDEGIQIDAEGLFSATPEQIARNQAQRIQSQSILDAFCGLGSNAIAFAGAGKRVFAIDVNEGRLSMAAHNATVYGIQDSITFEQMSVMDAVVQPQAEAIFLDPPWGGVDYHKKDVFVLSDFGVDMDALLQAALRNYTEVVLKAPLNFDEQELKKFQKLYSVSIEELEGMPLFKTIYFT